MARTVVRISSTQTRLVVLIGVLAGVGVFAAGPRPTGAAGIDAVLIIAAVALVTWGGATTPWWALIMMAGAASLIGYPDWTAGVGAVLFLVSLRVGVVRRPQALERAAIVGLALVVFARAGTTLFFGFTSIVGVGIAILIATFGLMRRPSADRRIAVWIASVALIYSVVALGALAATVVATRGDLSGGNQAARAGFELLKTGDFDAAQVEFTVAAEQFGSADDAFAKPWAQLTRLLPVANQHREAADQLAGGAAEATRAVDVELRRIDFDTLKVSNGRIDLDAVRALQDPMRSLQAAIENLDLAVARSRSPWLVESLRIRVDDLSEEIQKQRELGEKALRALELAPAMLGADGERVYFVMFTTPAEARGQGGFMGNYAELSLDDGQIAMTAFGSDGDLIAATEEGIVISGPEDWLNMYGPFGFQVGPDRTFDGRAWGNITMSPNFPSTAQVVAELYPQSGGREIDGVINLDVFAVQELVRVVAPLEVEGAPEPLTGDNTADFLLLGQYFIENQADRADKRCSHPRPRSP